VHTFELTSSRNRDDGVGRRLASAFLRPIVANGQ
jgi:hypothetical protein